MRKYYKALLYLLGGSIMTLLYRVNKKGYQSSEKQLNELNSVPLLQSSQLQNSTINDQNAFISGNVAKYSKLLKYLSNLDKKSRKQKEMQMITKEKKTEKRTTHISSEAQFVDEFQLQSANQSNKTIVKEFQNTTILQGVLTQKKKDEFLEQPIQTTIKREPQGDEEQQRFLSGDLDYFTTTIIKLGVTIKEHALLEGQLVCLFGSVNYNQQRGAFEIISPKFIGRSKQEIIDYLQGDINFSKFLGIIYTLFGSIFLLFFLKSFINMQNKEEKKNI